MRRLVMLVAGALIVSAVGARAAFALTSTELSSGSKGSATLTKTPSGVAVEPTSACRTVAAGPSGFEWRDGRTVCWLVLPVVPILRP